MERLRRPVLLWMLLVGILITASVASAIFIGPSYLRPKPDFSLQPVQVSKPVMAGPGGICCSLFRVRVTSLNGFTGIVSFSAAARAGLNVSLAGTGSPNPVAILGRNDTLQVSAIASSFGNYTLIVTGTYGELSHYVTLIVIAQSITFEVSPNPIVIPRTGLTNSTLTLTGVNGFSGNLGLIVYDCCSYAHPNPVFLRFQGTANVTLTNQPFSSGTCQASVATIIATSNIGNVLHEFNTVCS